MGIMNVNLEDLKNQINAEVNEANENNYESKYQLIYPHIDGSIVFRPLYNVKSNIVQKRLVRHDAEGRTKVPCLSVFGEDCPICEAIKNVEDSKGKDIGVRRKHGYKVRGLCFAELIDISSQYENVKKGDIVLLMYPKTVYDGINKIMADAGDKLQSLVCQYDSLAFILERKEQANKFPGYDIRLSPFCNTPIHKSQAEFEETLKDLDELSELIVPTYITDEIRDSAKALADVINAEYLKSTVVNPNDDEDEIPFENRDSKSSAVESLTDIGTTQETNNTTKHTQQCFGNYDKNNKKCILCMDEIECVKASKK